MHTPGLSMLVPAWGPRTSSGDWGAVLHSGAGWLRDAARRAGFSASRQRICARLSQIGTKLSIARANFGHRRSNVGRSWARIKRSRQVWLGSGRCRPKLGRMSPNVRRSSPNLAGIVRRRSWDRLEAVIARREAWHTARGCSPPSRMLSCAGRLKILVPSIRGFHLTVIPPARQRATEDRFQRRMLGRSSKSPKWPDEPVPAVVLHQRRREQPTKKACGASGGAPARRRGMHIGPCPHTTSSWAVRLATHRAETSLRRRRTDTQPATCTEAGARWVLEVATHRCCARLELQSLRSDMGNAAASAPTRRRHRPAGALSATGARPNPAGGLDRVLPDASDASHEIEHRVGRSTESPRESPGRIRRRRGSQGCRSKARGCRDSSGRTATRPHPSGCRKACCRHTRSPDLAPKAAHCRSDVRPAAVAAEAASGLLLSRPDGHQQGQPHRAPVKTPELALDSEISPPGRTEPHAGVTSAMGSCNKTLSLVVSVEVHAFRFVGRSYRRHARVRVGGPVRAPR